VFKILIKNCNLTTKQVETILIDFFADIIAQRRVKYEEKAKLRTKAVSRGAFNRTLRQARKRVISAIYTILLLGYLGILDETLNAYLELSERLREYGELLRKTKDRRLLTLLEKELLRAIENMAKPKALKP